MYRSPSANFARPDVDRWYLGFDQELDSANMHLYVVFQRLEPSVDLIDSKPEPRRGAAGKLQPRVYGRIYF
jgi:hypothetical protein